MKFISLLFPGLLLCSGLTAIADTNATEDRLYTFSWYFQDGSTLSPRGGSTHGTTVQLATEPSEAWRALQAPGLSHFERDRRAILAMAGEYRVSFDFVETTGFTSAYKPERPYRSWGTEKVYVVEDTGREIVLQHLLVMSFKDKEGKTHGPHVTKHWRQDWRYEPNDQLVYRGNNTWQRTKVPMEQQQGHWRQTVYQVDDSPRYSGIARWQHLGNFSSWSDENGWRPLPRREYSVRSDYDVLIGNNRHTITPTGWTHEQQNLKVKLDKTGQLAASNPVLGRESGFNRYERITGYDWSAGDRYQENTKPVWDAVRKKWQQLIDDNEILQLRGSPDKDNLFIPIYRYAGEVAEAKTPISSDGIQRKVDEIITSYLASTSPP
ncbi:hypothetical protein IHQ56_12845 [Methylobacillus flagellatus]|uniref:DUF6607 family protein n=1 Tax=Methylobacillus flagellatus TaxID=405 RepID=UPI0028541B87|nr:DUF6607 family protein [Methylobacillus flagellatus]MDR5172710.1 hypothetical protein [Methylobacillus flagellatus]